MAFIYVITNNINGKQYVGKTNRDIQLRFKEHIADSKRRDKEQRPLYSAINKYGVEHFSIQLLEECDVDDVESREIYWINKLNTYHYGYNATYGGDGKTLYNYKELSDSYKELGMVQLVAEKFQCDYETVRKACREYNVAIKTGQQHTKETCSKQVKMLPDDIIFDSLNDAAKFLQEKGFSKCKKLNGITVHIRNVCNGKAKQAYQHQWMWI